MVKSYWWRGKDNFGDRLTPWILTRLGKNAVHHPPAGADFVAAGSILEHLPTNWAGTVFGAGLLRPESRIDLTHANVVALRGKLTKARVKGASKSVVLGDPGLLVPKFSSHFTATYELGVVPHWSDKDLAHRFPYAHIIDVAQHPEFVIGEIARCRRIISSSLHGVIVADAYGIPRQAELFTQAEREGGDFKFRDYASVFDGDPHFGQMWLARHDAVERIQTQLWDALMTTLDGDKHVLP